jgi:HAD superfamily hydrolase (TIGR01509 family)
MSSFDLIIFDCDGVLVDSEIIAAKVESKLLNEAGYEIAPEEMMERFAGMSWKNILMAIEEEANIPFSASLLDKSEKLLDARLAREVKMIEGVKAALARLHQPRCICSNSSPKRLDLMLNRVGLKPYFDPHIFSAKALGTDNDKPKPDVFLHGAEKMNVRTDNAIVIEDSVHGVQAARSAGMRVIGFTGASHTYAGHADRLTDAGAETVISRMAELPAMVEALAGWGGIA